MGTETTKRRHFDLVDVESGTSIGTFRTQHKAERARFENAEAGAKFLADSTYLPGTDEHGTFHAMIFNALMESFEVREVG